MISKWDLSGAFLPVLFVISLFYLKNIFFKEWPFYDQDVNAH